MGYQTLVNVDSDSDTDTGNFTKSIRYQALQYRDSGPIPKVSPTPATHGAKCSIGFVQIINVARYDELLSYHLSHWQFIEQHGVNE